MKKLGKYEVLGELGHGAMGVVYRARDPIINRLVALKTITTGVADDPALLQRFYREAQSAGGLQHPNIVTIYDMGDAGALPYIAMELVEGENLEQLIARRSTFPITLKLSYAMQACRAFDYAHKRGIVHRDIKPGNVMVSKDGAVKVVDFGIARVLETSRTQTGMLIGTFAYMSPEQYHGEHADERSDIWSFGVLFYELLTYQKPFAGPTPASLMHNICNVDPAPICSISPDCPKELDFAVTRMLRKAPSERYQSMEDVLLDLEPIWKSLQAESVAELLEKARQLFDEKHFAEARDLARQVVQLESTNQQARILLEKANTELKRILNRPKVQQFVEKGQSLLGEGKLQEASVAAQQALQLDSSFTPAEDLQREIQNEIERARRLSEWLEEARQRLAEGLPDEAENLVAKVLEEQPSNAQAQNLLKQALQERAERERARHLLQGLQQARELWTRQRYDESLNLLQELRNEFPGEEEVSRLFETVRDDQIEQQKRQGLLQCRNLAASGHHDEAIILLSDLNRQFPNDEEIPALLEDVRKDQILQRRLQGLAEARSLLAAGNYESCISLLSSLGESFPEEQEISTLLEAARQNRAEYLRQQGITQAGKLLAARQYNECAAFLKTLEKQFPGDQEILGLQRSVCEEQEALEKQERLDEVRRQLAGHRFDECAALLSALESRFSTDTQVRSLRSALAEERSKQKRQQRLEEARNYVASKGYEKALAVLATLQQEFTDDEEVRVLHESTLRDQIEQRKQEATAQARNLLAASHYDDCIALLTKLQGEFPSDTAIPKLLESARREQADQHLREELMQARNLLTARHYSESIDLLIRLQGEFPGEAAIAKLLESARKEQANQRQRDGLMQARALLAERRFDESIGVLSKLQAEFPGQAEIARLLGTAREDLAEHQKELKLADARSLLAARSLAEALSILNSLAAEHPKDSAVSKLRALVQREQEKQAKEEKLQRELETLKKFMADSRYSEVIAQAKALLDEFPSESNALRLLEFATSRQADIETDLLLKQKLSEAEALFNAGRYETCVLSVESALKIFPGNVELQNLHEQSEIQQKKLKVRQQIEHRIREIRVKINRDELSDAVDLAKQTLLTLGPDTDLTHLLNSAQVEIQAREKKRQQEGELETIRTLIDSGDLDGASQSIDKAIESDTLDSFDPRIQRLSERLKDARTAAAREPAGTEKPGVLGLSKEYALATPIPEAPPAPEKPPTTDFTTTRSSSATTTAPPQRPAPGKPPVPASAQPGEQAPSEAPAQRVGPETDALPSTPAIESKVEQEPAVIPPPPVKAPVVAPAPVQPHLEGRGDSLAPWMKVAAGFIGFALVAAVWLGMRSGNTNKQSEKPVVKTAPQPTVPKVDPLEVAQRQALDAANAKIAANDLEGAIQRLQQGAQLNGPLTPQIQKTLAEVEESKNNAVVAAVRRHEADLWEKADANVKEGRYSQAEKLLTQILALGPEGVRKADAHNYLEKVIPQRKKNDSLSLQTQMSLRQKEYAAARGYTDQLRQNAGDAAPLNADIDRLESSELRLLESQFDQAKQGDDLSAVSQLTALQPSFQKLLQDQQFPEAEEARRYLDNIPGAINEVNRRVATKKAAVAVEAEKQRRDAVFQQALQGYRQGPQDKTGLMAARDKFQTVVQNDPSHADSARQYLTEIENKLAELNKPVPPPPPPGPTPAEIAADDEKAIRAVVDRFFTAFQARDPNALKQVWPTMPQKKYDGYKRAFGLASKITIETSSPTIQIAPDGSTATVTVQVQQQEVPKDDNKPRTHSDSWNFQLSKRNGFWSVTDVH